MSILIFIDQVQGHIKRSSFETACYGAGIAEKMGTTAEAVVLGSVEDDLSILGNYGVTKVHSVKNQLLNHLDAQLYAKVIASIVKSTGTNVVVFPNNFSGKAIAPFLSVVLKAGYVSGAVELPDLANGFVIKKSVFSGKAFANIAIHSAIKIISLNTNSYPVTSRDGRAVVSEVDLTVEPSQIQVTATNTLEGEVPLAEAELVVSGGRGLKGPENWGLLTDLAKALGAATACSRPVADSGWRPHHEHVGQTGLAIAPNLYFAIGISGAIQHLAGVNRSKLVVVINKDPEAPFFKAADYGIVGDAFEVVPKITEAVKRLKGE